MFCKNCGKQLPDTAKFCDGCGNRIQQPTQQVVRQPQYEKQQYGGNQPRHNGGYRGNGSKKKTIIIGSSALALVLVVVLVVVFAFGGGSGEKIPTFEGKAQDVVEKYSKYIQELDSVSIKAVFDGEKGEMQLDNLNKRFYANVEGEETFGYMNEDGDCFITYTDDGEWEDLEEVSEDYIDMMLDSLSGVVGEMSSTTNWKDGDSANEFVDDADNIFKVNSKSIEVYNPDNDKVRLEVFACNATTVSVPKGLDVDDIGKDKKPSSSKKDNADDKDDDDEKKDSNKSSGNADDEVEQLVKKLESMESYEFFYDGYYRSETIGVDTKKNAVSVADDESTYYMYQEGDKYYMVMEYDLDDIMEINERGFYDKYNAMSRFTIDKISISGWEKTEDGYYHEEEDYTITITGSKIEFEIDGVIHEIKNINKYKIAIG